MQRNAEFSLDNFGKRAENSTQPEHSSHLNRFLADARAAMPAQLTPNPRLDVLPPTKIEAKGSLAEGLTAHKLVDHLPNLSLSNARHDHGANFLSKFKEWKADVPRVDPGTIKTELHGANHASTDKGGLIVHPFDRGLKHAEHELAEAHARIAIGGMTHSSEFVLPSWMKAKSGREIIQGLKNGEIPESKSHDPSKSNEAVTGKNDVLAPKETVVPKTNPPAPEEKAAPKIDVMAPGETAAPRIEVLPPTVAPKIDSKDNSQPQKEQLPAQPVLPSKEILPVPQNTAPKESVSRYDALPPQQSAPKRIDNQAKPNSDLDTFFPPSHSIQRKPPSLPPFSVSSIERSGPVPKHLPLPEFAVPGQNRTVNPANVKVVRAPNVNDSEMPIAHAPTITPQRIDQVLAEYGSPARGMGQKIFDLGVKYGINPAMALAFYIQESSAGTRGAGARNNSWGNIRQGRHGYKSYHNIEHGLVDWYDRISQHYIGKGFNTLGNPGQRNGIIHKYAPASDGNNEGNYIRSVANMIRKWSA